MDVDRVAEAHALLHRWSSKAMDELRAEPGSSFAPELAQLALDNVFSRLWVRPGLDLRGRSLLTLGILIALRAHDELAVHVPIALANGVTLQELEEIIYHATAYAGFPAANSARRIAVSSLRKEGLVE